VDKLGLVSQ